VLSLDNRRFFAAKMPFKRRHQYGTFDGFFLGYGIIDAKNTGKKYLNENLENLYISIR